jgi:hypothetical protein
MVIQLVILTNLLFQPVQKRSKLTILTKKIGYLRSMHGTIYNWLN